MFKHDLGVVAQARVTKLVGVLTSRSENLYGCNRYYIQPPVGEDQKVPDGWWVDEDDINVMGSCVTAAPKTVGGPMSKSC